LLRQIAMRHRFSIHMTVTTTDESLARKLEPKAPPPLKRLEAVRQLADAGLFVAINAMPIFPGLTDSRGVLEELARAASEAGAQALYGNPLFLKPSSRSIFMPFLEREFPQWVARYRKLYAHSAYLRGDYARNLGTLLAELRARYGLDHRVPPLPASANPQLELPLALEPGGRS
jgi:DNA repair photolyase